MDREELIDYLYLRAQECGYEQDLLSVVRKRLEEQDMKQLDHLRRISEPAFRGWCTQEESLDS